MMELATLGIDHLGIWTRAEALAVVSAGTARARLYDGAWQSPLPGIYADGGYVLSAEQWGLAVTLASTPLPTPATDLGRPAAVACGRTAARVWDLVLIDDDDPATQARDRRHHDVSTSRHLRDVRSTRVGPEDPVHVLHRHQLSLTPDDMVQLPSGLWITRRERTLLDLTALLSHEALVCAIDRALNREEVDGDALLELAHSRRGIAWAPAFLRAVELSDAGAESAAETLARLILLPELPGLRTQVKVYATTGRIVARLDLADEALMLAVEPDGKRGHAGELMVAKDRRRDAVTGPRGWWTERVTWYELRRQQDTFRRRVVARAEKRRAQAA